FAHLQVEPLDGGHGAGHRGVGLARVTGDDLEAHARPGVGGAERSRVLSAARWGRRHAVTAQRAYGPAASKAKSTNSVTTTLLRSMGVSYSVRPFSRCTRSTSARPSTGMLRSGSYSTGVPVRMASSVELM